MAKSSYFASKSPEGFKKIGIQEKSFENNQSSIPFYCYLCNKNCVHPLLYTRHLQNSKHIRKLQNFSKIKLLSNSPKQENFSYTPKSKIVTDLSTTHKSCMCDNTSTSSAIGCNTSNCSKKLNNVKGTSYPDKLSCSNVQIDTASVPSTKKYSLIEHNTSCTSVDDLCKSGITKNLATLECTLCKISAFDSLAATKDHYSSEFNINTSLNNSLSNCAILHNEKSNNIVSVQDSLPKSVSAVSYKVIESVTMDEKKEKLKETANVGLDNLSCTFCRIKSFKNILDVKEHFSSTLHYHNQKVQSCVSKQNSHCALPLENNPKNSEPTNITENDRTGNKQNIKEVNCTFCGIQSFNSIEEIKAHFSSYSHRCMRNSILKQNSDSNTSNSSKGETHSVGTEKDEEKRCKIDNLKQLTKVECKLCGISSFNNISDVKKHFASEHHRWKMRNSPDDSLDNAMPSVPSDSPNIHMDAKQNQQILSSQPASLLYENKALSFSPYNADLKLHEKQNLEDVLHSPSAALQKAAAVQDYLDNKQIKKYLHDLQQQKHYDVVNSSFKIIDSGEPFSY